LAITLIVVAVVLGIVLSLTYVFWGGTGFDGIKVNNVYDNHVNFIDSYSDSRQCV
jgi:hypothetical protein